MKTELDKALEASHEQFEVVQGWVRQLHKLESKYEREKAHLLTRRSEAMLKADRLDEKVVAYSVMEHCAVKTMPSDVQLLACSSCMHEQECQHDIPL